MICLNKNSPEVQSMMEVSGLNEIVLGALVNMWMENNPGKEFPTLKDLGIEPVTAPSANANAGFIRIVLENYDVSLSGDRYKYNGNTYNENQIISRLLGISVSNNGVVAFNAKKFFETNKFVLDEIQEATGLSEADAIAMYQNYVTSSENPVNNLFNVNGFVDSMSIDYVEDAIIDEVDEVEDLNQRLKSGFLKDFNFTTEEYDDLKKALNLDATQAVSLVEKFIALKDGAQMDKSVAYIAYSLLGKANSKIRSELRYNIRSWDKYKEKFEKYKKEIIEEKGFINDKQKWKNTVRDKIIIDYLAETIVEYHNNPQQFEKIESKKWSKKDFSFIKKLYRAIIDFLGLNKPNSNKLKNVANAIANEVLTREYDILNYELAEGQILKGYEETINSDQRAKEIVTFSQSQGIILTGSLALRKTGKVYRTAEENLHDLDFVVPNNLTNFDKESLRDAFLEYKRIGLDPKDGIQASQFLFKKFIEKSEWFVNFKKQYPSYRIVNQFVGSEHMDSFASVTLTGVIDGQFDENGKHIEGTGYIIDHFVRLEKMQEEHENYFKLWKEIMIAKLMMGRAKDFVDFKAFVPFLASKDSYNFYYSDYVYLSKDEIVPANKKLILEGTQQTSQPIEIAETKSSLTLGKGSTTELDLAIRSYMLENPDATVEQLTEHLALSGIVNLDCSNTGSVKAKDGLTNSVSGTGWSIVKDFKGKPKHSQGGYDITIKDDGFYMGNIKAENGLLIMNQDPIYKTKLSDQEEKQFKDWYNKVSKYKNLDPNPDSEEQYYDYRGYWKNENRDEILKENTEAHFIDRYKVPGHPTFSNESMYSNDKTPGGSWSTGKDGTWYFTHSPYTVKYSDRTAEYLDGTGEFSIIGQDTIRNPNDYFRAINKLKTNKP